MKVEWSQRAKAQIRDIFDHIAQDRPTAAEELLERFLERVDLLAELPEQGKLWGDGRRPDLREIFYGSYRIVYRVERDRISVLSVRHTRMQERGSS